MRKLLPIFLLFIIVFLSVACAKKETAQNVSQSIESPKVTPPVEGMIKLKAYTAMRSGTGYKATIKLENIESTPTTAIVTIKLYYAKKVVAQKDMLVALYGREEKQFEVQFDNVPSAYAIAVESPNLINPARGGVTLFP